MVEALTKLGEAARRAREYISPWAYLSPNDVASNLPGGGIPAAVEPYKQGLQKTAEATQAFREGRWGDAARWYGSGMLDTATAGLSALPEGGAMAKLAMAMVPAFHGSKMKGLTEIAPSPRGALGPGAYFTPNENIARQYAGPEGQIYGTKIDDATIFQGIRSQDSSVNPYQVWRDQTAKLVDAAEPEMKQAVADLASRMDPNDGYPFWVRLAQLYKSEDGAQSLLKRAGFKGISGVADGPEIAMFDSVPLQSKSGLTEPEGAMQKLSGIRAFHGSPQLPEGGAMAKLAMALGPGIRDIGGLRNHLDSTFKNVDYWVSENPNAVIVNKVEVPKAERGQGIGTQFMRDVIEYGDLVGKPVALTPDGSFGTSKSKLVEWYKSLGFKPNKGQKQDWSIMESMVRKPE